jgi:hypothetical protein
MVNYAYAQSGNICGVRYRQLTLRVRNQGDARV